MRSKLFSVTLAAAVAVIAASCAGASGTPPRSTASPTVEAKSSEPAADADIQRLLGNMRAAIANHEMRLYHQFRSRLTKLVGQEQLNAADRNYCLMLANLKAATAVHDGKSRATFTEQLRALCGPGTLTSAIEFCERDLVAAGE